MSIMTMDAAPCVRRTLWSTSRRNRVTAQAASTVVQMPSPGIGLQLKGLQEFAVASLDTNPLSSYVQRDVQVIAIFISIAADITNPHSHRCYSIPPLLVMMRSALSSAARGVVEHIVRQPKTAGRGGLRPGRDRQRGCGSEAAPSRRQAPHTAGAHQPGRAAGLPLVYNEAKIAAYWGNKPGELAKRWAKFARISGLRWPELCSSCQCAC